MRSKDRNDVGLRHTKICSETVCNTLSQEFGRLMDSLYLGNDPGQLAFLLHSSESRSAWANTKLYRFLLFVRRIFVSRSGGGPGYACWRERCLASANRRSCSHETFGRSNASFFNASSPSSRTALSCWPRHRKRPSPIDSGRGFIPLRRLSKVLGHRDQLFDNLGCLNRPVVITSTSPTGDR